MLRKMITENSVSTSLSWISQKHKSFGKLVDSNVSVVTLFSQYFGVMLLDKHELKKIHEMNILSDNFLIFPLWYFFKTRVRQFHVVVAVCLYYSAVTEWSLRTKIGCEIESAKIRRAKMNLDVCSEGNIMKDFRSIIILPNPSLKKLPLSEQLHLKILICFYQTTW